MQCQMMTWRMKTRMTKDLYDFVRFVRFLGLGISREVYVYSSLDTVDIDSNIYNTI